MTIRLKMRSLGLSVFSLSFNLGGLLAGTLLALYFDVFSVTPWALLLFPGTLSVRGAIGGLLSGRLRTALHLGTVRASFTNNTEGFYRLLSAIIVLTFGSSILMGLSSSLYGVFLLGTTAVAFLPILAVSVATMGLSLLLISPITFRNIGVGFQEEVRS
jgi:cation transporter-like permease